MATSMPEFDDLFILPAGLFPTEIKAIPMERVGIKVFLAHITPDIAEVLLKHKNKNRTIHLSQLNKIKRSLEQGRWQINGETIITDDHGNLIEGQHRLRAVRETGMSIWTLVVHGINFERFKTMGQGSKRTVGDILGIDGEKDGRLLGAALRWVYRYEHNLMNDPHPVINDDELADTITPHPTIVESIPYGRQCHSVAAPGMCTALHYLCHKRRPGLANSFFRALASGGSLEEKHPLLILRNRFTQAIGKKQHTRFILRDEQKAPIIVNTWNIIRKADETLDDVSQSRVRLRNARDIAWHGKKGQKFPKIL